MKLKIKYQNIERQILYFYKFYTICIYISSYVEVCSK